MGILKYLLLIIMIAFVIFTTSTTNDVEHETLKEEYKEAVNIAANLTRKKKQSDLVIVKAEDEYLIHVSYKCFCGAEDRDANFPDVYINFVYDLDEEGTSWFKNQKNPDSNRLDGSFSIKSKFALYAKKDGKDRQHFEIHFYDYDTIGKDDYLGTTGKIDLGELAKSRSIQNYEIHGGEVKRCSNQVPDVLRASCHLVNPTIGILLSNS